MMTGFDAKAADQIFGGAGGGSSAPVSFDTAAADEALAADTQAMLTLNAHEAAGKSPDQVAHAAQEQISVSQGVARHIAGIADVAYETEREARESASSSEVLADLVATQQQLIAHFKV